MDLITRVYLMIFFILFILRSLRSNILGINFNVYLFSKRTVYSPLLYHILLGLCKSSMLNMTCT